MQCNNSYSLFLNGISLLGLYSKWGTKIASVQLHDGNCGFQLVRIDFLQKIPFSVSSFVSSQSDTMIYPLYTQVEIWINTSEL